MRFKVVLTQPTVAVPVNNQGWVNGFNHEILGAGNKWHNAYSDYAISSLQGGKLDVSREFLTFPEDPYIMVSSEDSEFLEKYICGAMMNKDAELFGMRVKTVLPDDFEVYAKNGYDKIITISPILLKDENDRKITIEDDNWIERLCEVTRKALLKKGIEDDFRIEFYNRNRSKTKMVFVKDVFNVCSMTALKVYGSSRVRKAIYSMGLGNSTGSGFGSVKVYDKR